MYFWLSVARGGRGEQIVTVIHSGKHPRRRARYLTCINDDRKRFDAQRISGFDSVGRAAAGAEAAAPPILPPSHRTQLLSSHRSVRDIFLFPSLHQHDEMRRDAQIPTSISSISNSSFFQSRQTTSTVNRALRAEHDRRREANQL